MNGAVETIRNSMGEFGFEYISDTEVHTATGGKVFVAIQVVSDAVINAITTDPKAKITGNTFTGETLSTGTIIRGKFLTIDLTSGKVIAYKGV